MSYPPPGPPGAYPPYGQPGYPPPGAYPPQPGYEQYQGYPPQAAGYPPQPGAYPPQPGAYPPQPYGAPPQAAYGAPYGAPPQGAPYGAPMAASYGAPPGAPYGYPPQAGYPPPAQYPGAQPGGYNYPPQQQPVAMQGEVYAPTVRPEPNFNVQKDCEVLRKAMKGLGTDEAALIAVICKRSWQQRAEIEKAYQQMFGKSLEKEVASETGGHFHQVLERLLKTPIELAAYEIHHAMCGAGTDEEALVEFICTKGNEELRAIEAKFQEMYHKSLQSAVSGETSGYFRRLLVSLLTCNRPPDSHVDWAAAAADAKALYEAGAAHAGTDEARFNVILAGRSFSHLRAVFDAYQKEYKKDITDVIKSEFSGDIQNALLAVVACIRNRIVYFATRLHYSMAGAGTRDEMLLRIIASRCDFDLGAIKAEYQRMYGKPLSKAVQEETSGDYKKALVTLIGD